MFENILFSFIFVGCSSIVADTIVAITCPSNTAVNIDEKLNHANGDRSYSKLPGSTLTQHNAMDACKDFLICTVLTRTVHKLIASMNLELFCKGLYKIDLINTLETQFEC